MWADMSIARCAGRQHTNSAPSVAGFIPRCVRSDELDRYCCRNRGAISVQPLQRYLGDSQDNGPFVTGMRGARDNALLYQSFQLAVDGSPRANAQCQKLLERQWLAPFFVIADFDN